MTVYALAFLLLSAPSPRQQKEGTFVEVKVAKSMSDAKPFHKFKKRVEGEMKLSRDDDFFGRAALVCNVPIKNPTKQKLRVDIHLAVFDSRRMLIGTTSQGSDMDPGKETQFGSLMVFAPLEEIKKVKYAVWRIYVAESKKK